MLSVQRSLSHLAGLLTSDQLALLAFPVSQWPRLQTIPFTAVGTFWIFTKFPILLLAQAPDNLNVPCLSWIFKWQSTEIAPAAFPKLNVR